nr:aldo/keto reductase [Treponema sp.]
MQVKKTSAENIEELMEIRLEMLREVNGLAPDAAFDFDLVAHPYFTQKDLRITLDKYGIKLMSWYPLGHGDKSLIEEPVFAELGEKYGKSPAQVILRWHIQMGFVVIPGSKNVDHIKDNLNIMDFELTADEMAKIAMLDKSERYYHRTEELLVQFAAWKPDFEKT